MPTYGWILIIVGILLFISCLFGLVVAFGMTKPKRRSLLDTSINEENLNPGVMDFYKKNKTKEYDVKSSFGYDLRAYYFKNKVESNKYVVMAHGHTYTHHGCAKYARMMMNHGYNIILFDERFHGNSGGNFTSLGHLEKTDLDAVITDTFKRFGPDIYLGTYGESMGAVTVLLEAEFDKRIKFIISDCGFSNLDILMDEILKNVYHIPKYPFKFLGNVFFRLITGSKFSGISPIKALNTIDVPILFVHGKSDNFISYSHAERMYDFYQGPKKIFIAGNESFHAGSYSRDTENYEKNVSDFLGEFVKE
ncbi:alpha/beta hydrolase [Mycoplasmatota bacterium WC30]